MVAAALLGIGVSLVAFLQLPYFHGGANTFPNAWTFRTGPMRPTAAAVMAPTP